MVNKGPPTSYQVDKVSAKTGLPASIIKELYPTFSSIYAEAGNFGSAQSFGQTVATEDVTRSLRHVFYLLILWLKKNETILSQRKLVLKTIFRKNLNILKNIKISIF